MGRVYTSVDQLIGATPLMELTNIEKSEGLQAKIYAKLEYFNPAGSVKDRVARTIIDDAEESGRLAPGGTIIEPTSGNTGIGLAAIAAARAARRGMRFMRGCARIGMRGGARRGMRGGARRESLRRREYGS